MTVRELRSLLESLPSENDSLAVVCKCSWCDCETFVGERVNAQAAADPELPSDRPGNVPKLIILPE